MTYQSESEERLSDQQFEEHQDRLAEERDEVEALAEEQRILATHDFGLDDVCKKCGYLRRDAHDECDPPEVTRDNQRSGEIYVITDGPVFYCVDGLGRWYYNSEEEALEDVGVDVKVNYAESVDE